jgi:hypothetical protein
MSDTAGMSEPSRSTADLELTLSPSSGSAAKESLTGPARQYLLQLLKDIITMLSYANGNGIALPDDLRVKVDVLFNDPDVNNMPISFTK